ncbi:D-lactate dehydrogenase [cytochrome], mitochondrial [Candida viswanathii]|uniref:D-lactate dehydrogenase (cytochrome) n=1 Tax=Candida viswanathii TaxID=5486 RepID=A0A367YPA3_9ASCO|nr:D-lactate dehydrogenase [cytochrome], mitochondrial [Candida viswanathii]
MFSTIRRSSGRLTKQWLRYKSSSSNAAKPTSPWLTYALLGVGFLGTGFFLGNSLNKNKVSALEPADRSTAPLSSLLSPVYANDEEFQTGLSKIVDIVGKDNVSFNKDVLDSQNDSFYSTHHPPNPEVQRPSAVVFPNSTQQVSEILKVAHEYRIPIVANSGLTSLEGHNMHTRGPNSISVSFLDMNNIVEFHPDDLDIVVQPGVGWQELDDFLLSDPKGKGLKFGPDPGIGANIGGMVGTSASGTNAFKYGTMKENVVNLTVVLADGTIIKTRQRPRKSSAGYHLTRLFIGSEGTLGLVTEITLKLHVRPKFEYITVAAFPSIKDATSAAATIIAKGIQPNAMEILNETMMAFVNETSDPDKKNLETPTLFFKLGGPTEESAEEQAKLVEAIAKEHNVIKLQKSTNEEENAELWAARRNGLWSTFQFGSKILPDKDDVQIWTTDVAVPISKLSLVITEINDYLIAQGLKNKFSVMGHIGDGNCHFLIVYNSPDYQKIHHVVDHLVTEAIRYDGTCTGEHGVGVGKRRYLPLELGETTIDTMRQIKLALDPRRILNPDKIFKIDPNENLDEELDKGSVKVVPQCMTNH